MWGLRKQVSLLLDHGHPDAPDYPLAFMWEESQLVVERINSMLATETSLLDAAVSTGIAQFGKEAGKARRLFADLIKRLSGDGGAPEPPPRRLAERLKQDRQDHGR